MYARILVPVDASLTSEAGVDEALRLARLCGGQVRLVHVLDELPFVPESAVYADVIERVDTDAAARGRALLARLAARAAAAGVPADTLLVESVGRSLHTFVTAQADAWGAELIVLGTHGRRGVERLFAGSVAEQVLRHACVPVLLVRCAEHGHADDGDGRLRSIAGAIA